MEYKAFLLSVAAFVLVVTCTCRADEENVLFQDIIDDMEIKSDKIRTHPFLAFLRDESIPARRRMSFAPYLTYLAVSFADIVDTWLYVQNPTNELEERINIYVNEDDSHYNLLLHDIEKVLGYNIERFGSFTAVIRHLWGEDSRATREYVYGWLDCLNRYKDPIITLTTFEAFEIGAQPLIDAPYYHVFLPENGIKELKYFGQTHVEMEMNHTQFNWFDQNKAPVLPLGHIEITQEQKRRALEVSEEMYNRTWLLYDNLHELARAEETIWPEKYRVEGYPSIRDFPPKQKLVVERDEL